MHFTLHLVAAGLLSGPALVSAGIMRHSRRGVNCFYETPAASGDTCESLAVSWGSSLDIFVSLNPGVGCPDLEAGKSYCVLGESTPDEASTSTTVSTSSTTTSTSKSSTTTKAPTPTPTPSNTPTMPGIAANCDRFYKVKSGDQCLTIASSNAITVAQLRAWNTQIDATCSNLWLDYYICTHIPGAVTVKPSTTSAAPVPTNSPALPGIVGHCDGWYKIKAGDTCDTVAAKNKLAMTQLRGFNTKIDATCSNLLVGYYACVSVPDLYKPMPGIVANCSRFYRVAEGAGDTCASIAAKTGITVANFRKWNTLINAACSNIWAKSVVCTLAP